MLNKKFNINDWLVEGEHVVCEKVLVSHVALGNEEDVNDADDFALEDFDVDEMVDELSELNGIVVDKSSVLADLEDFYGKNNKDTFELKEFDEDIEIDDLDRNEDDYETEFEEYVLDEVEVIDGIKHLIRKKEVFLTNHRIIWFDKVREMVDSRLLKFVTGYGYFRSLYQDDDENYDVCIGSGDVGLYFDIADNSRIEIRFKSLADRREFYAALTKELMKF